MNNTLYPCFYSSVTGQLLACTSASNPSQRCPVNYTRVGQTTYCQPNQPVIVKNPGKPIATTSVASKKTPALVRTGGTLDLVFPVLVVAIFIYGIYLSLFSKHSQ